MVDEAGTAKPSRRNYGLTVLLAAGFFVMLLLVIGSGKVEDEQSDDPCIEAWNTDPIAPTHYGQAEYGVHGYRDTLVTRVDQDGNPLDPNASRTEPIDARHARCAVILAGPQNDLDPGFGAFVFDSDEWASIGLSDKLPPKAVRQLQREATALTNATLLADGTLADR